MIRKLLLALSLSAVVAGTASAQPSQYPVYDQNNSFGLSNAGVTPGPYLRLGGGYSYGASGFGNSGVFGAGVGYRFAPFFRMDATFDYRPWDKDISAGDARLQNWAAMLNAYLDINIPFIRPLIPYVGAGVGLDQNKVGSSTVTVSGTTTAHFTGSSRDQFAWQAMAGVSWYFTPTLALDVGYRYFYGGSAESGSGIGLPVRGDYSTHEIVAAVRFGF